MYLYGRKGLDPIQSVLPFGEDSSFLPTGLGIGRFINSKWKFKFIVRPLNYNLNSESRL